MYDWIEFACLAALWGACGIAIAAWLFGFVIHAWCLIANRCPNCLGSLTTKAHQFDRCPEPAGPFY